MTTSPLGMSAAIFGMIRATASESLREAVNSQTGESGPCSACAARSIAYVTWGEIDPFRGGEAATTNGTPATLAVVILIIAEAT